VNTEFKSGYFYAGNQGKGWYVSLPHQCDTWDIIGDGDFATGGTRKEAIDALTKFLTDGVVLLAQLEKFKEEE
jgi:hypothetical protein